MKVKSSFNTIFKQLRGIATRFDAESAVSKASLLNDLKRHLPPKGKLLLEYSDVLLFLCSHAQDGAQLKLVEKELERVTSFLKKKQEGKRTVYENSGLPYATIFTRFSHDCLAWMLADKNFDVEPDSFSEEGMSLADILKLTLPILERERTAAGYAGEELLEALKVKPKDQLRFIVNEFNRFNDQPFLKDQLFESLNYYVKVNFTNKRISKFYNRITTDGVFYHADLLKKFDSRELLERPLPPAKDLDPEQLREVVDCVKNSLVLKSRETDPVSYMDQGSLRLFRLERGISVAIYGITAKRQLPLESYIGYTLFKNGFPAAYGGSWIFGSQALFGMNIFESYRGGESAFMMCQLLRVYRQVFGVNYFEIEPYQFGKDNPEGIESGAYWFYYRLGFRSIDKEQFDLAEKENVKIKNTKGYRSSPRTLKQLAESYVALTLGDHPKISVGEISQKVTALIAKKYHGDRIKAEEAVLTSFRNTTGLNAKLDHDQFEAMKEMAFVAASLDITSPEQLNLLKEMVLVKPKDVYRYQELTQRFLVSVLCG